MKSGQNVSFILGVMLVGLCTSCLTGQYGPQEPISGEVLGTVQTSFVMQRVTRKAINMQAYIHLVETASRQYEGAIDVVAITWVIGRQMQDGNTEYTAAGKVVKAAR
jgi:hypothetical protein